MIPDGVYLWLFAGLGAFINWLVARYGPRIDQGIEALVDEILSELWGRVMVQLLIFSILGAFVGVLLIAPATQRQAFAAGATWTGLLGGVVTIGTKKGKGAKGGTSG